MARKKKKPITAARALPPAREPPAPKPSRETVVIHTTRERRRNAGGSPLGDKGGAIVPLVGGVAGGVATVYGAEKFGLTPLTAAGVGVAAGLGLQAATKSPLMKQALMGVAIGAGTLGGLQLIANARAQAAKPAAPPSSKKRQAEGDGFITRDELNDALSKLAEAQKSDMKEQQKRQTCDLLTALRDEVKRIVADTQRPLPQRPTAPPLYFVRRQADGAADSDVAERNAVGVDDYMTNAYGSDASVERNADGDSEAAELERNADGEDEAT